MADASLQVDMITDLVSLDSSGDAVLAVGGPDIHRTVRFLISTKVLSLASPVLPKCSALIFKKDTKYAAGKESKLSSRRTIL